jgi:hypothetical protein
VPHDIDPSLPVKDLRQITVVGLLLLLLQFLLGTLTALYVQIPSKHPWSGATHASLFYAHVVLGVVLFFGSFMVIVRAQRSGVDKAVSRAWWAVGGMILAVIGGEGFVNNGQYSGSSLLMAVGFAVAATAYVSLLWLVAAYHSTD